MNSGSVPSTTETFSSSGTHFQNDSKTHRTKKRIDQEKYIYANKYLNLLLNYLVVGLFMENIEMTVRGTWYWKLHSPSGLCCLNH